MNIDPPYNIKVHRVSPENLTTGLLAIKRSGWGIANDDDYIAIAPYMDKYTINVWIFTTNQLSLYIQPGFVYNYRNISHRLKKVSPSMYRKFQYYFYEITKHKGSTIVEQAALIYYYYLQSYNRLPKIYYTYNIERSIYLQFLSIINITLAEKLSEDSFLKSPHKIGDIMNSHDLQFRKELETPPSNYDMIKFWYNKKAFKVIMTPKVELQF